MENNNPSNLNREPPSGVNSPSKIPAPRSRVNKQFFAGDASLTPLAPTAVAPLETTAGQKRKQIERSPPRTAPTTAGSSVRVYRANATGTARPPVTKPAVTRGRHGAAPTSTAKPPSMFSEALSELEQISGTKKRSAWDTKGRLEDMEHLTEILKEKIFDSSSSVQMLQEQLAESEARVKQLETFRETLNSTVTAKEEEKSRIGVELSEMKAKFEAELASKDAEFSRIRTQLQCDLEAAVRQRDALRSEADMLQRQLQESREESAGLRGAVSRNASALVELESKVSALKSRIEQLEVECQQKAEHSSDLMARLNAAQQLIAELEGKVQSGEALRRKLHNDVQELKGNIRVFCRVRPLLSSERSNTQSSLEADLAHLQLGGRTADEQEAINMLQEAETASGQATRKTFPFAFDRVFGPSATQDTVFSEISQLVQSALDGYRVCIFAYGQTGSGKTFTMEGGARGDTQQAGMIPRAVEQVFSTAEALREKGWTFAFESSYLEIYNETIRDLLSDDGGSNGSKYEIRHTNGRTTVTDLLVQPVSSPQEVLGLLSRAAHNRAVAETQCNERSSRSHSVFTLRITGENILTTERVEGLLNLVDLAGSERLSQSGSTGDRLKETQAINKSLSSLGDVIFALANKEQHVPFRNSKLTYLLQHSLGGNCKTLMFVNVSPAKHNFQETLCSLRFATKVNACQIGTARRATTK